MRGIRRALARVKAATRPDRNEKYWSGHNVTLHAAFASPAASLEYFHWRCAQYYPYLDLMPVAGQDGKVVLDYGCGPGDDLVGFAHYSRPARLIGADISAQSLAEAADRLKIHGAAPELIHVTELDGRLPLADGSIDYVHSSGVIHHTRDPVAVLRELRRVVRPDGHGRVMVYNYDSLWVHLYVAYVKQVKEGRYPGMDIRAAFARTTDGEDCPISRAYRPAEFCDMCRQAGFDCGFQGAAVSMWECSLLPQRFEAVMSRDLAAEHRDFLLGMTLDDKGMPRYRDAYAGIDGCYLLRPI
jgi:SAM-dependent methyltransferase